MSMNMSAVIAALKSPKTPTNLKKGLMRKYGHQLSGIKLPMSALASTAQSNPRKTSQKKRAQKKRGSIHERRFHLDLKDAFGHLAHHEDKELQRLTRLEEEGMRRAGYKDNPHKGKLHGKHNLYGSGEQAEWSQAAAYWDSSSKSVRDEILTEVQEHGYLQSTREWDKALRSDFGMLPYELCQIIIDLLYQSNPPSRKRSERANADVFVEKMVRETFIVAYPAKGYVGTIKGIQKLKKFLMPAANAGLRISYLW